VGDLEAMTVTKDGTLYLAGHTLLTVAAPRSLVFKYANKGFLSPVHIIASAIGFLSGYSALSPAADGGVYIGKG
jgi:hypothetical protein